MRWLFRQLGNSAEFCAEFNFLYNSAEFYTPDNILYDSASYLAAGNILYSLFPCCRQYSANCVQGATGSSGGRCVWHCVWAAVLVLTSCGPCKRHSFILILDNFLVGWYTSTFPHPYPHPSTSVSASAPEFCSYTNSVTCLPNSFEVIILARLGISSLQSWYNFHQ